MKAGQDPGMFLFKHNEPLAKLSHFFAQKKYRHIYIVLFVVFIVLWQLWFFEHSETIPYGHRIEGAIGGGSFVLKPYQIFLVFFKQFGVFPVGTLNKIEQADVDNFEDWLKNNSNSLVNEMLEVFRAGDRGKLYLLWFDSLFRKSAFEAGYFYSGFVLFLFSLIVFFLGFASQGKILFASIGTILIGSNSFQLFEIYRNNNIFGIPICVLLFTLGLNARWIAGKTHSLRIKEWGAIVLTGFLIGAARHIRADPTMLIFPLLAMLALYSRISFQKRILCVMILLSSFFVGQYLLEYNFIMSFNKAKEFVKLRGGHPYEGNMYSYHRLWHPIFCGLADFGGDKGYRWDDLTAYNYALPYMRMRLGNPDLWKSFSLSNNPKGVLSSYYMDTFYDSKKIYPMKLEDFPVYERVLRRKVLADIRSDPIWYMKILWRRVKVFFSKTTGLDLSLFGKYYHIEFGLLGLLTAVSLLISLILKDRMYFILIILSISLAASAVLIYSGGNSGYYSIAHIFSCLYLLQKIFKFFNGMALKKEKAF